MMRTPPEYGLRGKLELTNVSDLLQFLEASGKNGALGLSRGIGGKKARIYFVEGSIAHAASGELDGLEALAEVLGWDSGEFNFSPDVKPPRRSLDMPIQHALMEAAHLRDELRRNQEAIVREMRGESSAPEVDGEAFDELDDLDFDLGSDSVMPPPPSQEETPSAALEATGAADSSQGGPETTGSGPGPAPRSLGPDRGSGAGAPSTERRTIMAYNQSRDSTDVLEDLLKVPGVDAVVVVGRDGFVIESSGSSSRLNIDALGAALAHAINGIEEMGGELHIDSFSDLFIEYGRAVLLCRPVGEAVAVLVTPDASKLGIIRHKAKGLFSELGSLF